MEASEKTAWFSLLINLLLVAIKAFLALLSDSLAIKADSEILMVSESDADAALAIVKKGLARPN